MIFATGNCLSRIQEKRNGLLLWLNSLEAHSLIFFFFLSLLTLSFQSYSLVLHHGVIWSSPHPTLFFWTQNDSFSWNKLDKKMQSYWQIKMPCWTRFLVMPAFPRIDVWYLNLVRLGKPWPWGCRSGPLPPRVSFNICFPTADPKHTYPPQHCSWISIST